jgi:hypothetical protein
MKSTPLSALGLLLLAGVAHGDEAGPQKRLAGAGAAVAADPAGRVWAVGLPPGAGDADLAELCELRDLRVLGLDATGVSDAGLRRVAELRRLETLYLNDTGVGDAGLEELYPMKGLRLLDLRGTKTTDDGVARLRRALPGCAVVR